MDEKENVVVAPVAPEAEVEADVAVEVEKAFARAQKTVEASVSKSVSEKLDASVKSMKADLTAFAKSLASTKTAKPMVSFDVEAYNKFASSIKANQKADFLVELKDLDLAKVKTVGDISIDGNITGELPQAELDTMVSRDPQRAPFIEELVTVGTISSNLDAWIETTGEEGAPLPVAELDKLPQKDYDFVRRTAEVKKIGVYSKYSTEMAEDLPNLVSEIKNFLVADLKRTVDEQILSGDGTGDELVGILENAVTYSAGTFAGTISRANHFDVIETAASQVITALHTPNYVVVHPTDMSKMRLAKDANGQYVLPPFIASNGSSVSGLRVVANTGMAVGTFLVGDFSKSSVKYKKGLTLEMTNTDQDDFVKDRFTVKATVRLVQRVRENDYEAFVTGSFATAIASLESGS
jgi:HK97 family phage major capsid protein